MEHRRSARSFAIFPSSWARTKGTSSPRCSRSSAHPFARKPCRLYDRLIEQGRAEGKAEGKAEGEASGRAQLLLKLLQLKFGALPDEVTARVVSASIDELDRWGERVLAATTLNDVLR
ncbi:MAG: DUF4351 domain-containing protein [Sandaracinaceae bacterium]|nr:DUF4351 domain-containing protein [Sandaracinaceae bacterium]